MTRKTARVPVDDEVYVAIRKDGDLESADLGTSAIRNTDRIAPRWVTTG